MPVYTCPECETKVKRKEPVAPGKKLRCPECDAVFTVKGQKAPVKKPEPAAPSNVGKWADEDDGPALYGVTEDHHDEESEEVRKAIFDPLAERFERSKRGPALELVVKPSNYLLLCGVLACFMAIGGAFWSIFPMIFKVEEVQQTKKGLYTIPGEKKTRYIELTDDEKQTRFLALGGCILFFLWGAVICAGASKLHEIEMYWLAMVASIMAFVSPVLPIAIWLTMEATAGGGDVDMAYMGPAIICYALGAPVALWNIATLRQQKVIDGFGEEAMV